MVVYVLNFILMYFLKYRPQTIEELDLQGVRNQLKKILKQKKIPHAFLFAGPKGVGKTSAARILAKVINCPDSVSRIRVESCNRCDICQEIIKGISLDILEIDAASNRGIDDIRQLKERVGLAPIKTKYKVYIIDEVHMLTREAFNALLKTLEEPPLHVVFVLCTTNPEKIIPTVLSRLLRINFHKGNPSEVNCCLNKVIKGEKLTIDKKIIDSIVQLADGSFRDAQKILESLVLSFGKKIKWKDAKISLGYWQSQKPEKILRLLGEKKLKDALEISETLAKDGTDFSNYFNALLNLIQKLILLKVKVDKGSVELTELIKLFEIGELVKLSRLFSRALVEQKTTVLPQLPFQLAMIDFVKSGTRTQTTRLQVPEHSDGGQARDRKSPDESLDNPGTSSSDSEESLGTGTEKKLKELGEIEKRWREVLEAIKPMNHSVAAFLRATRPKAFDGETVTLEVFYQFHKDKLEENRNREIVEKCLGEIYCPGLKMRCVLGENKVVRSENKPEEIKIDNQTESENSQQNKNGDLYEIAKEIFGS